MRRISRATQVLVMLLAGVALIVLILVLARPDDTPGLAAQVFPSPSKEATPLPYPWSDFIAPPTPRFSPTAYPPPEVRPFETEPPDPTPQPPDTPTPILSPRAYPTPEWTPYTDKPFNIVYMRNGELWMSEIGGRGEWVLTHEKPEWGAGDFVVSPDGQYILYMVGDQSATTPSSQRLCLKLLRVQDGSVQALTNPDEPYGQYNLAWRDARHATFQVWPEDGFTEVSLPKYTIVSIDVATGERTTEPSPVDQTQSPDGRYVLLGNGAWRSRLPHWLKSRETGEQWEVTTEEEEAVFLDWSPDSRWMLFALSRDGEGPDTLFVVEAETRARHVLTQERRQASAAAWSPDSKTVAYVECARYTCAVDCALWLVAPDGSNRRVIPASISDFCIERLAWTADGSRLVFNERLHNPSSACPCNYIWSVRADGSDLRPIAIAQQSWFDVLP